MYTDPKRAYLTTRVTTSIHDASPHKLITLLLDACHENLAISKGAIDRNDVKLKVTTIRKAIDIIVNLQACLDFEQGGEIAKRLDLLYTYCTNRLAIANASSDSHIIGEVMTVIAEIKSGWLEINPGNSAL